MRCFVYNPFLTIYIFGASLLMCLSLKCFPSILFPLHVSPLKPCQTCLSRDGEAPSTGDGRSRSKRKVVRRTVIGIALCFDPVLVIYVVSIFFNPVCVCVDPVLCVVLRTLCLALPTELTFTRHRDGVVGGTCNTPTHITQEDDDDVDFASDMEADDDDDFEFDFDDDDEFDRAPKRKKSAALSKSKSGKLSAALSSRSMQLARAPSKRPGQAAVAARKQLNKILNHVLTSVSKAHPQLAKMFQVGRVDVFLDLPFDVMHVWC